MIPQPVHPLNPSAFILGLVVTVTLALAWPAGAQETDQEAPVGAVGGPVHADLFTGTATTSIPIEVPPGRGGIQPDLALVYGSSNGNGWLGMGWKLEKGVIDRQTKFGVDYAGDDYVFRLSGINVELVNIGNNEYRSKIEGSFTRVEKLTATDGKPYFEATDKTGTRFIFGSVAATRVADPNNANNIFRWCLERVEDTNGNYMTIRYTLDQGQAYLRQIDYTGNDIGGLGPTKQILFHLEDRPDAPKMYVPNFEMTTAKRLKTIEVKANGNLVRAYALTYSLSSSTSRSILSSVQQFGKDARVSVTDGTIQGGTALPGVTMQWQQPRTTLGAPIQNPIFPGLIDDGRSWLTGDLNHDGRTGVMFWWPWSNIFNRDTSGDNNVHVSNGNGAFTTIPQNGIHDGDIDELAQRWLPGDFNGDGNTDLFFWTIDVSPFEGGGVIEGGENIMYVSDGDGTFTALTRNRIPTGHIRNAERAISGDFNGDGKTDLLFWWTRSGTNRLYVSNGNGTFTPHFDPIPVGRIAGGKEWTVGDFNGDGRTDVYFWWPSSGTNRLYVSNGNGTFTQYLDPIPVGMIAGGQRWTVGDFNGDGRMDVFFWWTRSGTNRLYVSNGNGRFTQYLDPIPVGMIAGGHEWRVGDFNGDGRTDAYFWLANSGGNRLYTSSGHGRFTEHLNPISSAIDQWTVGDFNGDGRADVYFWFRKQGTNQLYVTPSEIPDLLSSIGNGLGATTHIEYTPSTEYNNTFLPYPVQTVNKITTNDGNGHVATTTYDYAGGFHHMGEREFRGFNYVKMTGPAGANGERTITETWFHQGNDTAPDVNNPNVPDGYLKGAPYRVGVKDGHGNLYTVTVTSYTADADGHAPFFAPPASVATHIYDGTARGKTTRTDYRYDRYGNVIKELQFGDIATRADDRFVVRTYSPNTSEWILGLPITEVIYQDFRAPTPVALMAFYYDGTTSCGTPSTNRTPTKGNLTRVVEWLNTGPNPETRMAYDRYGNVICTRDALGSTTTMTYDGSRTFATSVTNQLGHTTTTSYYGVDGVPMDQGLYGQVKTVTDPNNQPTTTKYDVLGRRIRVDQPNGLWTITSYKSLGTVGSQHVRTDSTLGLST